MADHTQNSDTYLAQGTANQCSAAELRYFLDNWKDDEAISNLKTWSSAKIADALDALVLASSHTQNTDQLLASGTANQCSAAELRAMLDSAAALEEVFRWTFNSALAAPGAPGTGKLGMGSAFLCVSTTSAAGADASQWLANLKSGALVLVQNDDGTRNAIYSVAAPPTVAAGYASFTVTLLDGTLNPSADATVWLRFLQPPPTHDESFVFCDLSEDVYGQDENEHLIHVFSETATIQKLAISVVGNSQADPYAVLTATIRLRPLSLGGPSGVPDSVTLTIDESAPGQAVDLPGWVAAAGDYLTVQFGTSLVPEAQMNGLIVEAVWT